MTQSSIDLKDIINNDANYLEFIIYTNDTGNNFNINVSHERFEDIMTKLKSAGYKHFGKEYKVFRHDTLVYKNNKNDDVKLYNRQPISCELLEGFSNIICCQYQQTKLPIHMFPCSMDINDVHQSQSLIFRVHNRIYLNFEVQTYPHQNNNIVRKIFVNYHHDDNVDMQFITSQIVKVLRIIEQRT